ncbi:heparan-alpha-glucosaminide N-acetyltransferase domain-containing protein [Deinococcus sonorensis]|uniref:Heparan-alpha-glucosaminide N-acetyltransferase domain-containing protein n=2 Tax=Deinococcus sonorensis TaxID=309891 RepID=A0AAU7UCF7_9DEIO
MSAVSLTPPPTASQTAARPLTGRLSALDAWRGLTVLLMLLVNNVALDYKTPFQLQHAPWGGGLTLTDLVFPWFLFCAGAALPFSLAAARRAGLDGGRLGRKQLERGVLLYLVGALLTSAELRQLNLGLGVLQLIALASLAAGLLSQMLRWEARLGVAALLLVGYDLFLHHYPLTGGQTGTFTADLNAVKALNETLLAPLGLRGLISVVPATALVLLGSAVAQPLKDRLPHTPQRLLALGVALTALGWLWAHHLEFNKAVWTPSYVLYTSGLATLGLLTLWLIGDAQDGRRSRWLSALTIPGRNALFAYVAPILFKLWIFSQWRVNWTGTTLPMQQAVLTLARQHLGLWSGGWVYSLGYVLVVWLALAVLARRGLIWKL